MKAVIYLIFTLIPFLSNSQNSERYRQLAEEKLEQGELKYALNLIEQAIQLDSTDIDNYDTAVVILYELRRLTEAKRYIDRCAEIHPYNSHIYNMYGEFHMINNQTDLAVQALTNAISYAPDSVMKFNYFINRATAHYMTRNFALATKDLEGAYQIDSTNLILLNNLAALYGDTKDHDMAIKIGKRTTQLYPEFSGGYMNLAMTYTKIDSFELALEHFERSLKYSPNAARTYNNRGFTYYKMQQYKKALKDINHSLDLYPENSYAYRNRSLVYLALDLNKEACRDLEIAAYYDFKTNFGDEVEQLLEKHCND